jgi:arginyl-tRNA synthetase
MADAPSRYRGQFRPEFSRLYEDRDLYWITPFSAPRVLGVFGARFAGVGSVVDHLVIRQGYRSYSLGSELRRIAEERGVPVSYRRYLQDLGDQVRAEEGDAGYLARRVLRRIRDDSLREPPWALPRSIVISGIKTDAELKVLRSLRSFRPVVVRVAEDYVRFERASKRGPLEEEHEADRIRQRVEEGGNERPKWSELGEAERRKFFDERDEIHLGGHPGNGPEEYKGTPAKVIAELADPIVLENDGSLTDLHARIDADARLRTAHQLGH